MNENFQQTMVPPSLPLTTKLIMPMLMETVTLKRANQPWKFGHFSTHWQLNTEVPEIEDVRPSKLLAPPSPYRFDEIHAFQSIYPSSKIEILDR